MTSPDTNTRGRGGTPLHTSHLPGPQTSRDLSRPAPGTSSRVPSSCSHQPSDGCASPFPLDGTPYLEDGDGCRADAVPAAFVLIGCALCAALIVFAAVVLAT